jgi:hypothetical protein
MNTDSSNDSIRQELAIHIKLAADHYGETLVRLIDDARVNPASAITWSAEGIVKAQSAHEIWMGIERGLGEHEPREVIAANTEELRNKVRWFFGSNSTSVFANAVERARAEEYIRQLETLEGLGRRLEI